MQILLTIIVLFFFNVQIVEIHCPLILSSQQSRYNRQLDRSSDSVLYFNNGKHGYGEEYDPAQCGEEAEENRRMSDGPRSGHDGSERLGRLRQR